MVDTSLFTYKEAAKLLHVSEVTLRRWVSDGRVRHLKLGGYAVRFRPEHIEELLSRSEVPARGGSK